MRRLVLDDVRPGSSLIEVPAKVLIRPLRAGNRIRTADDNQVGYRNCPGRKAYRVHSQWIEMSRSGRNDREDAVRRKLRQPSNQGARSRETQQDQFGRSQLRVA